MAAVKTAKVVDNAVQVVVDGLFRILKCLDVRAHIEVFKRERHEGINFFLLANLCICEVHEAATSSVASILLGLESLQVNDHDFGDFVKL